MASGLSIVANRSISPADISSLRAKEISHLLSKSLIALSAPVIPAILAKLDEMDEKDLLRVFNRLSLETNPPLSLTVPLFASLVPKIPKIAVSENLTLLKFAISGRANLPDSAKLAVLGQAAEVFTDRAAFMSPRDISDLSEIFAKEGVFHGALLTALATAATVAAGAFKPREMTDLLFSLTKLNFRSDLLLDRSVPVVTRGLGNFHVKEIFRTLEIYGRFGNFGTSEVHGKFLQKLEARLNVFTKKTFTRELGRQKISDLLIYAHTLGIRWRHSRKFAEKISAQIIRAHKNPGRLLDACALEIADPQKFGELVEATPEIPALEAAHVLHALGRRFRSPLRYEEISDQTKKFLSIEFGRLVELVGKEGGSEISAGVISAFVDLPPDVLRMHKKQISDLLQSLGPEWEDDPEISFFKKLFSGAEVKEEEISDFFVSREDGVVILSDWALTRGLSGDRIPTLIGEAVLREFGAVCSFRK